MSIINDKHIKQYVQMFHKYRDSELNPGIGIIPFTPENVQPASYDVRLGNKFVVLVGERNNSNSFRGRIVLVPGEDIQSYKSIKYEVTVPDTDDFRRFGSKYEKYMLVEPGDLVLAETMETFHIPPNMVARVEGKSSLGRLGLSVHSTAGFIDPGFQGTITLELHTVTDMTIALTPGMLIAQVSFQFLIAPAERPYGSEGLNSKYQGQQGPTESKYKG